MNQEKTLLYIKEIKEIIPEKQITKEVILHIFESLRIKYQNLLNTIREVPINQNEKSIIEAATAFEVLEEITNDLKYDFFHKKQHDPQIERYINESINDVRAELKMLLSSKTESEFIQVKTQRNTKYANLNTIEDWIEKAKEHNIYNIPISEVRLLYRNFLVSFENWTRKQKNGRDLREQVFIYNKIENYSNLTTIEDWIEKAKELKIFKISIYKVLRKETSFYNTFCRWSNTQENSRLLREQLFEYKNNYEYSNFQTIEDWKNEAIVLGLYQISPNLAQKTASSFYNSFIRWTKTKGDSMELRKKIFLYEENQSYVKLKTFEDWKKKAKELGVYQKSPVQAQYISMGFYCSFTVWTKKQENPLQLRKDLFSFKDKGPYAHLKTIEDWINKSKELNLYKSNPSEYFKKEQKFYKRFVEWSYKQENTDELRAMIFTYHEKEIYLKIKTIEDWIEKAKELGAHKLTPMEMIRSFNGFYSAFNQWVKFEERSQEYREMMWTYEDNKIKSFPTTIENWRKYFMDNALMYVPKSIMRLHVTNSIWESFQKFLKENYPASIRDKIMSEWFPTKAIKVTKTLEDWEQNFETLHLWSKQTGPSYTTDEMRNHPIAYIQKVFADFTKFCADNKISSHILWKYFPRIKK